MSSHPNTDAVMAKVAHDHADSTIEDYNTALARRLAEHARDLEQRLAEKVPAFLEYRMAAPLCDKHLPRGGGTRSGCLVCGLEKLSAALSRIDYACDEPNDMEVSGYDVHCNEDAVVRHVRALRAERDMQVRAVVEQERELTDLTKLLRDALPVLQNYARDNPMWMRDGTMQDPQGVHATLVATTAFLVRVAADSDPPACRYCGAMAGTCVTYPNCPAGTPSPDFVRGVTMARKEFKDRMKWWPVDPPPADNHLVVARWKFEGHEFQTIQVAFVEHGQWFAWHYGHFAPRLVPPVEWTGIHAPIAPVYVDARDPLDYVDRQLTVTQIERLLTQGVECEFLPNGMTRIGVTPTTTTTFRQFRLTEERNHHADQGLWTVRRIVTGCSLDDERIERLLHLRVGEQVRFGQIHITRVEDA